MRLKKYFYKKVESTNNVAVRLIKQGNERGIIMTEQQSKGKGRRKNKWISMKGNLFLTVFFEIGKKISLSAIINLNLKIIKKIINKKINSIIQIKKPNDLLINNRKFCGILQETIEYKNEKFIIIGIGLNLVKSPNIKNYLTTNILKETGLILNKKKILKIIEINYRKKLNLFA